MNILIVNLHSSHNAGDAVLTRVSVQQLKDSFPDPTIILSMNDPDSYEGVEATVGSFVSWLKKGTDGQTSWRWAAIPGLIVESLLALGGYWLLGRPVFLPFSSSIVNFSLAIPFFSTFVFLHILLIYSPKKKISQKVFPKFLTN